MNTPSALFIPVSLIFGFLAACSTASTIGNDSVSSGNGPDEQAAAESSRPFNFVTDLPALGSAGNINVVVEIPAGTTAKWEVSKPAGTLEWENQDGKPRIVNYLGYPGNYGMIPRTLLPKHAGGDGDPLDAIVIGTAVERGVVVEAKLIGVLRLLDRGEQDDKLIAILKDSPLSAVNSIDELDARFPGVSDILEIWFSHYKGQNKLQTNGFGGPSDAREILDYAIASYNEAAHDK